MFHFGLINYNVCDYSAVKVPIAILGAEIDQLSPPALVKEFEEILTTKPEVGRCFVFHGHIVFCKSRMTLNHLV